MVYLLLPHFGLPLIFLSLRPNNLSIIFEDPEFCYPVYAVDKHDPWQRLFFSHRFLPEYRMCFAMLALVPAEIGNTIRMR